MIRQRTGWGYALLASLLLAVFGSSQAYAAERLKPFVLAATPSGDLPQVVAEVKQALSDHGFTIVGSYAPYANAAFPGGERVSAQIIGITSPALQRAAMQTEFGGFAAVQRVTVTEVKSRAATQVQVAFTNPSYMAGAYRLKDDLAQVTAQLEKVLGMKEAYGSRKGLTAKDLSHYHYKVFMPYFNDADKLAQYDTYEQAVSAVQAGLAAHRGGTSAVYQVALPGKQETLFGVALSGPSDNACSGDQHIMSRIDFQPIKSSGHLPYEMLVVGKTVYALPAKFRIAINFPDLSMMGSNSFLSIMCAPGSIKKALKAAAGGH